MKRNVQKAKVRPNQLNQTTLLIGVLEDFLKDLKTGKNVLEKRETINNLQGIMLLSTTKKA